METVGVVFRDPAIEPSELSKAICQYKILETFRTVKKNKKNGEGYIKTHLMKVIFAGIKIPDFMNLNSVIMPDNTYTIPVMQYFACLCYGNVASSQCKNDRLIGYVVTVAILTTGSAIEQLSAYTV